MAKKEKEPTVEQIVEEPKVDENVEKLKVKKPKMKNFKEPEDGIVKVDLKELTEKTEDITKVDLTKEPKETKEEQPVVILEEITEDIVVPEKPSELPESVDKLVNFMRDTGGDINDYIKLNQNYEDWDNDDLIRAYYKDTKPHLDDDEISFVMEDNFKYDESYDDEKDIKMKKIALKEQVAQAKHHLESVKSKYYEDIKMGSKLNEEQQEALKFFSESKEKQQMHSQAQEMFIQKTEEVFNDEFKGFEYKVGDKRYRYNVNNVDNIKTTQSDLNNFVGKFLNENNQMENATGYHKGLFTAMNSDAIANHFYEQGKADALKNSIAKSKNINMDPRQSHRESVQPGVKVRVLGDDSPDFKFKIKKNK
jgi:hypothetical protein